MIEQALSMISLAEKQGHALLKCDTPEDADRLVQIIDPMVGSTEDSLGYGVTKIREREVNIYAIRQMPSEEERERILWQNKKRYWAKQAKELKISSKKWWNSQKQNHTRKSKWSKSSDPL